MNRKQTVFVFVVFFLMLAVITIPLWIDRALPRLWAWIATLEHWFDVLKGLLDSIINQYLKEYFKY